MKTDMIHDIYEIYDIYEIHDIYDNYDIDGSVCLLLVSFCRSVPPEFLRSFFINNYKTNPLHSLLWHTLIMTKQE